LAEPGLTAFFKERFAAERSDLARAEAVRSVGKADNVSSIPFLEACLSVPSHRNVIANAASQALARVRRQ